MKIAFLYIGAENLGIEYLSSILKQKKYKTKLFYDPSLFDDKFIFNIPFLSKIFTIRKNIISSLIEYNPDLIVFSVFTDAYQWSLEMAKKIKQKLQTPILFGGVHPTAVPEKIIRENAVDMINIGEGFESLLELVQALEKKEDYSHIKNLWVKKNKKIIRNEVRKTYTQLDNLPFPDKELFRAHFNINNNYLIMTSFGCPYHCTYCSNDLFLNLYKGKGSFIRRRNPENVIEELKTAHKRYKLKIINFMDDIFTTDKKWLKHFFSMYNKKIKLPFRAISHPKYVDEEVIKLLKKSGCYRLEFGVQSVNEKTRKNILKRIESNNEIAKAFSLCEKHKLEYMIDHIYGIPTEDEKQQIEAAYFYSHFKPARIANFWLVYYPKTEIINIALKLKLISKKNIKEIEEGYINTYHDYGSVTDKKKQKMFNNFAVFFLLISLLPKKINKKLAHSKILFKLHYIPYFIQIFLDFMGGLKYKDYDTITFAQYYLKYMVKAILIKLKLKKY